MKHLYNVVRSYLNDNRIDLNERLSTFFIYMGILAAILGTGICILAHVSVYGILATACIAVGAPVVASVTHMAGRGHLFGVIIAIGLTVMLPVVWLTAGGSNSGVNVWFVYELFYMALFTTPKKLPRFAAPAVLLMLGCFFVENRYPALVTRFAEPRDAYISILGSILVVSVTIVITVMVQKQLYNNERANNEKQEDFTLNFIMSIASIIDAKDSYTGGHSKRVAVCATEIGRHMGMSEDELSNLHTVALLHDIGKIGIPDGILNNPGALTDREFDMIRQHPVIGGNIVKELGFIPHVEEGVMYHHERYDGHGYPSGLKGEEIPLLARIICVADSYDAMSTNRVYRKRLENPAIIQEFERCKGAQFDPYIADVFIDMLKSGYTVTEEDVNQVNVEQNLSVALEKLVTSLITNASREREIILPPADYSGDVRKEYPEYAQMLDYIHNLGRRFDSAFVPVAVFVELNSEKEMSASALNGVMRSLNTAITGTIRAVDVCTRYNSSTFLIVLVNARRENLQAIFDRIEASFRKTGAAETAHITFRTVEDNQIG